MKNPKHYIILGTFACLALIFLFIFLRGTDEDTYSARPVFTAREPRPFVPTSAIINGTTVFYDLYEIEREEFMIQQIIGRTSSGYIATVLYSDRFEHGRAGLEVIRRVSECLTQVEEFFAETPEWRAPIFMAVDYAGQLYVFGLSAEQVINLRGGYQVENVYLFVYNEDGVLEERHHWPVSPYDFPVAAFASSAYVSEDNLVFLTDNDGFIILSKAGDVLYRYTEDELTGVRFVHGTVNGGYLYGLFEHNIVWGEDGMFRHENRPYSVRKIEIPTGRVVWEKSWYVYTGEVEAIAFCGNRGLLYLFQSSRFYAYDEGAGQLHLLKDLNYAGFRTRQNIYMTRVSSIHALRDGRLFFSLMYVDYGVSFYHNVTMRTFAGYKEWLFTPLFGEAAYARIAELAQEWEDIPVIRFFDITEGQYFAGTHIDFLLFAEERDAFAELTFLRPFHVSQNELFQEYSEALITEMFAGTADWDIIIIPPNLHLENSFSVDAFVERGMLLDLLPFVDGAFIEDNERFYTNLFRALMHGDGLYHIPRNISVPFVLVPRTHPELFYFTERSLNWTWADFLEIVRRVEAETGAPPLSADVPLFFLFDEDLLLALGRGQRRNDFAEVMGLYAALVNRDLHDEGGVFTFEDTQFLFSNDDSFALLPLPTMRGEHIFFTQIAGHAVLSTGSSPELAAEFIVNNLTDNSIMRVFTNVTSINSLVRPNLEYLAMGGSNMDVFAAHEAIIEKANTFPSLPSSVRLAIYDAVVQYVHGALSRDAAVQRVADIMWIFVNE